MGVVTFEPEPFNTLLLHCYKHPSLAVNGILLGREAGTGDLHIVKAVPLFHGILSLLPMLEAAMLQIDELCETTDLKMVGYYHANERLADSELGHIARKVGERLQSRFKPAVIVLVDNHNMKPTPSDLSLTAYSLSGQVWQPLASSEVKLESAADALAALARLTAAGAQHVLNDFDSHLDDVSRPWLNQKLQRE